MPFYTELLKLIYQYGLGTARLQTDEQGILLTLASNIGHSVSTPVVRHPGGSYLEALHIVQGPVAEGPDPEGKAVVARLRVSSLVLSPASW